MQLTDAQQKFTRAQGLAAKQLLPQSDLDAAKTTVDSAQASLQSAQATVAQTQAAVRQSQASVNQNQVNLDHTIIAAPIDGIVTQRSVDVGQTVAASMQAPTLFIIAADLTKMQVNANIDESDVGRIRPGQHVTFRVDAYPTDTFEGTVSQIRLQPVVVQNVTTYGTVIDVPNAQLKLKPGMTANVKVEIARRTDALRVPNAALRFRPSTDVFAALNQPVPPEALAPAGGRGGRGGQGRGGNRNAGADTAVPPPMAAPAAAAPAAAPSAVRPEPGRGTTAPSRSTTTPAPPSSGSAPTRGWGGRGAQGGATTGSGQAADAGGQGGERRGGGRGFDPARMMERFKGMSPDEQKQFIARIKDRGQDTSLFEKEIAGSAAKTSPLTKPKYGAPQSAQTIDALFAPLPVVESRGRAWVFMDKQLKPVSLRTGISDGTNTELLGGELQQGQEVVTSVSGLTATRAQPGGGTGNPLIPAGGRGPGGFGGPPGGRGR